MLKVTRLKTLMIKGFISFLIVSCNPSNESFTNTYPVFKYQEGHDMRWSSPENPNGEKGAGGKENGGAKGRPYLMMHPGSSLSLLDVKGSGMINRIWATITAQNPATLRSLKIEMFWDGSSKPAVSAPFGDFFSVGLGRRTVFQNAFFANPEGRSFNCFIPMPFRTGAKIIIYNESKNQDVDIYYDVDYTLQKWDAQNLYFHAYWHRDTATTLAEDFEILPPVKGKGRFLGSNIGVNANPGYGDAWWGEGEVKVYKDGDDKLPTLTGTGTEDYIGTGWGQKVFTQNYTGCTVADTALKQWAFYRYHVIDPIYFKSDCKVTIQQMGGTWNAPSQRIQEAGVPMIATTTGDDLEFKHVFNRDNPLKIDSTKNQGWINFYRSEDVSAVAYFYLDKPENNLPAIQPLPMRIDKLRNAP